MKINFETRKKARAYCKQQGLRPKDIKHDNNAAMPWYINTDELTSFVVGEWYRISDENGFTHDNKSVANVLQLQQIKKFLPDGFKIIEFDGYSAKFEHPVGVSFFSFHAEEIQYMVKIPDPTLKPAVSVVAVGSVQKEPEIDVSAVLSPDPDTLSDLDKELDEPVFEIGKHYQFINIVARNTFSNKSMSNCRLIDSVYNGCGEVYTISHYDSEKSGWVVSLPKNDDSFISETPIIFASDRRFFKEIDVSDKWIIHKQYRLSNPVGFIAEESYHNKKIAEAIDLTYGGVITILSVNEDGDAVIDDDLKVIDSGSRFLWQRERKYFTPVEDGTEGNKECAEEDQDAVDSRSSRITELKDEIQALTYQLASAQDELFKLL